jgi:hypothetical protein
MKAIFFIAALALLISPMAADANLVMNEGGESSAGYWTFSPIGLLDEYYQAKDAGFSPAGNPHGGPFVRTTWVSKGSVFNFQYAFQTLGNSRQSMGWTPATTALLLSSQTTTSSGSDTDFVHAETKPDQIPVSIIFFAPGLAGILVRRNWPQKLSLRTLKRSIFELIHPSSGFPVHGNLLRRILLMTGFVTYYQFIHFKLRTIQLNQ